MGAFLVDKTWLYIDLPQEFRVLIEFTIKPIGKMQYANKSLSSTNLDSATDLVPAKANFGGRSGQAIL